MCFYYSGVVDECLAEMNLEVDWHDTKVGETSEGVVICMIGWDVRPVRWHVCRKFCSSTRPFQFFCQ
jgi:hypothetical protein